MAQKIIGFVYRDGKRMDKCFITNEINLNGKKNIKLWMEKIGFSWYLKRISFPALMGYLAGIFTFLIFYK